MVSEKLWNTGVLYYKQDFFYPFCASLAKKKKYLSVKDEIRICCSGPKISFSGKFGPKNQNFLFKMKLSA